MTNLVAQLTNSISPINGLDVVNAVNGFNNALEEAKQRSPK
jgi:hypothetical protein